MSEMELKKQEDEISLIDLFAVLLKRKWMIIGVTCVSAVFAVVISIISLKLPPEKSFLPNSYAPQAQMLINDEGSSSSSLGSLSSLASIAGINLGNSNGVSNSALASYLISSNTIQDAVINKFGFIEKWKIKKAPLYASRDTLKKKLQSSFDSETGVFTLSFEDIDPELGCEVVNYVVELLEKRFKEIGVDKNQLQKTNLEENINSTYNEIVTLQKQIQEIETTVQNVYSPYNTPSIVMDATLIKTELAVQEEVYKQLKVQYESLKVTMASEKPVFQILEFAEVPDMKSGPSRGRLCIIITFGAFFISVFLAFLLNGVEKIKQDSEIMAKLKGKK